MPSPARAGMLGLSGLAALLVLLPILSLVTTATGGGTETVARLAQDVLPDALQQTGLLLLGVAVVAGSVGIGCAWLVTAYSFPGSRLLAWLLPLPLAMPTYVAAFIYVELLDAGGPVQAAVRALGGWRLRSEYWFPEIRSLPGCILVMSAVLYPYVFVPARAAFLSRGHSALEAARTLGARGPSLFRRVALPMARPAFAVGLALALLETLNDVGATEYLGVRTLTLAAYTAWLNASDLPAAAQLASCALVAVAALIAVEARARAARRGGLPDMRRPEPIRLSRRAGWGAALLCALPLLLGLVAPLGFLAREVLRRDLLSGLGVDFLRSLGTTLGLSGAAALAIVLFGVPIVLAARSSRHGTGRLLAWLASLGYAVPGTFLVLGLLPPLYGFDAALKGALAPLIGPRPGLLLAGSAGILVLAYAVRFLRVAVGPLGAQLDQTGRHVENAARVHGAGTLALARHVQLPLLRPAIAAAALLAFVDCVKELPATLLLRPLNVETLATLVYASSSRGTFEDGAAAALAIVLVCLGPIAWLTRWTRPGSAEERALEAAPG